jgi:ribosomal protein S18 acetylase RimI-like enzyme
MSSLIIRPCTERDIPAVQSITWETWMDAYASFVPVEDLRAYFEEHYSTRKLEDFLKGENSGGFIAECDSVPAGYARTSFNRDEGRFYVQSLYVLPAYQGHGLGTKLLAASEERALDFRVDAVWLGVMVQNVRTVEWYRKIGFHFVEEAPFTMAKTTVNHLIGYRRIPSV